ncbi:GNAT family acetyltransferase [Bifidobacterium cuniculi]|uniref:GNAT family acetyltransferase n=2 Tax=Bifidobacterium cuniculi TaxID=1688 RepID=A0A087ACA3_9BIFI|nr:GNAT family acetyltransferase [Bifidobacterium cuniculi]
MGRMSEDITYRALESADYPTIEQLLCDEWGNPAQGHDLAMKLAEIDLEDCLARTTCAQVAVADGKVVGVVLGGIHADLDHDKAERHHGASLKLRMSLDLNPGGHEAYEQLKRNEKADRELLEQAKAEGHAYDAEVVLLLVDASVRGQGIGQHLFDWLLDQFKEAGVQHYFLHTDSRCQYRFYDKQGLARRAVLDVEPHTPREDAEMHAEQDRLDDHLHAMIYDNETSPANEGVNPLGRD